MNRVVLPTVIGVALSASEGWASGFQVREQSAAAMGRAFAGVTAEAADLSTLFYNPAGMTRLEGSRAGGDVAWVVPSSRFSGSNSVGAQATGGSDGGNHARPQAAVAAYLLWDAAPDWRVGLALTTPFGMRSDYREDWVGRYHALDDTLANVNLSPSVAWRFDDRLSVAVGLQAAYTTVRLSNALNFNALAPGSGDGELVVDGDAWGLGWTASALYEPMVGTRFGLAYRSGISNRIRGKADFQGVPDALAGGNTFGDSDVASDLTLPDSATLGIHHELSPQWAVMSDVSWTHWSVIRRLRVSFDSGRPDLEEPQNWNDTWFASLGVAYIPHESLRLSVGVAYDMAPIDRSNRTARLPDSDRYWVAAGVTYSPDPRHSLSLSYAHLFAGPAPIDHSDPNGLGGRLVGSYDNHVDLISVSYRLRF